MRWHLDFSLKTNKLSLFAFGDCSILITFGHELGSRHGVYRIPAWQRVCGDALNGVGCFTACEAAARFVRFFLQAVDFLHPCT